MHESGIQMTELLSWFLAAGETCRDCRHYGNFKAAPNFTLLYTEWTQGAPYSDSS